MTVIRFILRTSLASLALTYCLDWLYFTHNANTESLVECGQFRTGAGLDTNGQPFQV